MQVTEHAFKSFDGAELFYRAWTCDNPARRTLLLFHRGHEHSGRWHQTVESLNLPDCNVYAWDQRGHGRSSGARGQAENIATIVKDADVWMRHLGHAHGVEPAETVVLAHSIGATIAAAWVHDYAPAVRGLVLAAPAFRVKLYVPLALPMLRLKQRVFGPGCVKSYVKAGMLTHDPEQVELYKQDPMIFRQIAVNLLLDLHDTSTRLLDDAAAITAPTLMLAAEKDWIVKLAAQREFFRRLGSTEKQFELLSGCHHAIFHDTSRKQTVARIRAFLLDCFSKPAGKSNLLNADRNGYTRDEFNRLNSPRNAYWSVIRAGLKTGGRLSRGIRLGWNTGFDSGASLDYVYENKPNGTTPVGKLVDYFYLNSIGWRGIRFRRDNLQKSLRYCIDQLHNAGRPVQLLDVASGPARYVLETMRQRAHVSATAVLRDNEQSNLDAAAQLAARLGVGRVKTVRADAFDFDSLAATHPRPTIAIASGLYELIPDNAPVRRSLEGIAAVLKENGYLIYTCQPWHPQIKFIARVLTNRNGRPWVMRRRTQAEMDELVSAAGFEKIAQEIDPWGLFTVSIARKGKQ